jgi:hypothetical protein
MVLGREPFLPQYFGTAVGVAHGRAVIGSLEQVFLQPIVVPDACDCNGTGQQDWVDIRLGLSEDLDGDGVPDECACDADLDGNGDVGFDDLLAVLAAWGPCGGCAEDIDGDGSVAFGDLLIVLSTWGPCP